MKPTLKWPLIFGGLAAFLNLGMGLGTSICALLVSPAAAIAASYMVTKDDPRPNPARHGALAGLTTGAIASTGLLIGTVLGAFFWNAPMLAMTLASANDLSDIGAGVTASAAGAFFVLALAVVVALVSTGICAGVGALAASLAQTTPAAGPSSPP
jgi:hypothetical protein